MKTIKLYENESLIDSFDLNTCVIDNKLKEILERKQFVNYFWESPFSTKWYQTKLFFTSNRIEFHRGSEILSHSYHDIKGIEINTMRNRPKNTGNFIGLSGFLGVAGGLLLLNTTGAISILGYIMLGIGVVSILYLLIFQWVMTYKIDFGKHVEFAISVDDSIIERIKDAYEKGKNLNIMKNK